MNIVAITQARTGSTRLPNKVLKTVNEKTLLQIHLERILKSGHISKLVVATTIEPQDDQIAEIASALNLQVSRGSVKNVLDRFYQAAKDLNPDYVVRLTSDCPLIDAKLIDQIISKAIALNVDYCSNGLAPTFPDGMDVEVIKFSALKKAWEQATTDSDKEHVTPYIYLNSTFFGKDLFKAYNFVNPVNYEKVRLTVDEPHDFEVIKLMIEQLGTDKDWQSYADHYLADDTIKSLNEHTKRNEGYFKT